MTPCTLPSLLLSSQLQIYEGQQHHQGVSSGIGESPSWYVRKKGQEASDITGQMKSDLGAESLSQDQKEQRAAHLHHWVLPTKKSPVPKGHLPPRSTPIHTRKPPKSYKERRWQNPGLSLLRSVLMAHMRPYVKVTQQVTLQQP